MTDFIIKFSGWLLLFMLAMILFEVLAVGVFAAGWCLHTLFGHYAFVVVPVAAALVAWIHHRHEPGKQKGQLRDAAGLF